MLSRGEQVVKHLPAGEGETLWLMGGFVTLKVQSDEMSLYEVLCPPEAGPPPHVHHRQDEGFYVLEGTFSILRGDETFETGPGSFVWLPRGTLHTFEYTGEDVGRILVTSTFPGSHESFFRDVGIPVSDMERFEPPDGPPEMEKVMTSAKSNDMYFVLPEAGSG